MKSARERNALHEMLDLSQHPERVVKSINRRSLVFVAVGLLLLFGLALFNRDLNDAAYIILSFFAGASFALGYAKYVEAASVRFMGAYLDSGKLEARRRALESEQNDAGIR